LCKTGTLVCLL
nr:immunoglobulin heavy chain junction region [Mus musculus]